MERPGKYSCAERSLGVINSNSSKKILMSFPVWISQFKVYTFTGTFTREK